MPPTSLPAAGAAAAGGAGAGGSGLAGAILGAAGIGAGGSLLGGILGSSAAQQASAQQAATARRALDLQQQMFGTIEGLQYPFIQYGQQAATQLANLTGIGSNPLAGPLTTMFPSLQPFAPTMQQLSQTPGYQFTLGQGLQATQNAYAAQGLGSSGAALKGAANYAEGLAGTTFQQQFQNYLQQQGQQFNQYWQNRGNVAGLLSGQVGTGASAASTLGTQGVNITGQSANTLGTLGAAQASGTVGSANALIGGLGGATSSIAGALPSYALAPLTQAYMANIAGMYGNPGTNPGALLSSLPDFGPAATQTTSPRF